jgi:hypothetical protein
MPMRPSDRSAGDCLRARAWLSADRDEEASPDPAARAYVERCAGCRRAASVDALTRRVRLHAADAPDVVTPALAAARRSPADARGGVPLGRALLAVAGLGGVAVAVLSVVVGVGPDPAGRHLGWELLSLEAALGVSFCLAAWRLRRHLVGLVPVTVAAALLTLAASAASGAAVPAEPLQEVSHLFVLLGLLGLLSALPPRWRDDRGLRDGDAPGPAVPA